MRAEPLNQSPVTKFLSRRPWLPSLAICAGVMLACLSGCDDDLAGQNPAQEAPPTDPGTGEDPPHGEEQSLGTAFVLTTDFMTGSFATISLADLSAQPNLGSLHGDAAVRYTGDRLVVLNRLNMDNLLFLDHTDAMRSQGEHSVGAGTNPVDVIITPQGEALVARMNASSLLFMDPDTGAHLEELDLTPYADEDGLAEPSRFFLREDGKVLLTCGRLDQDSFFSPTEFSSILVIDVENREVVEEVKLAFTNPTGEMKLDPISGDLLVGATGQWGALDGGIERFDPTSLESKGVLVTEEEIGGDLVSWEVDSQGRIFVLVSDGSFQSAFVRLDPSDAGSRDGGVRVETITSDFPSLAAIAIDPEDRVFLADRDPEAPGVRIFNEGGEQSLTNSAIDTGLPPMEILFLP